MPKRTAVDEAADKILAKLAKRANRGGDRRSAAARALRGETIEPKAAPVPPGRARKPFAWFRLPNAAADERAAVRGWTPTKWRGELPVGVPNGWAPHDGCAKSYTWDVMMCIWRCGSDVEIEQARWLLLTTKHGRNAEAEMNLQLW